MKMEFKNVLFIVVVSYLGILFLSQQSYADTAKLTQTIRGNVIDRDSKSVLPGANIIVENTNPTLGSSTDLNGNFVINNVPLGRLNFKVMYIGYEASIIPNILVGSGKEVILNIELVESIISADVVVVTAEVAKGMPVNEMASVSTRAFSVEETGRYAASINDPARMASSFAGVVNSGQDALNEIVIRGNSPRGMLWQIEGVPVANPNHFADEGTSGGAVCLISNNMLDNSDFMIGAWPAGYGNALSGIFDINFRKGNAKTYEHAFQFGMLGVDFSSEGPLSFMDGASYLVNYRYSTLALFDAAGIQIIEKNKGLPEFQDISYKLFLPSKKFGVFSIWGIGGLSRISEESDIGYGETYDNKKFSYLEEEGEETKSDIGIAGITHMYFVDNSSYFKSAFSYNGNKLRYEEDGIFANKVQRDYIEKFKKNQLVFSSLYNRKVNAKNTFRIGLILNHINYKAKSFEYNYQQQEFRKNVDASGNSILYQGYLQSKYKLSKNFSVFAGLHSTYFELNDKYTIEPRLSLKWKLTDKQSLTFGAGIHSQLQPLSLYLINYQDSDGSISQINKNLDFSKARHYAVSYDDMLFDQWQIKVELYYQDLYSIPIAKDTSDRIFNSVYLKTYSVLNDGSNLTYTNLVNKGTGKNYGVELTIEKFLDNGWYFLSTNSFYQAKYKGFDGIERDTRFNGNYTLNLLAGKEYNFDNNILGFNTRLIRAGGKRDYPVQNPRVVVDENGDPVIDPITGEEIVFAPTNYEKAFSKQADDYFRVDFGVSYRMNYSNVAHIFSFDIQNVLNKENIRKVDKYDVRANKYIYNKQAGIIPNFEYRFEF